MKQVTINIPENKFPFFMKLMQSLNFVKVVEPNSNLEDDLTQEQIEIWDNVKEGFQELNKMEAGKLQPRPLKKLLDEI